jgi:hypothetical protein
MHPDKVIGAGRRKLDIRSPWSSRQWHFARAGSAGNTQKIQQNRSRRKNCAFAKRASERKSEALSTILGEIARHRDSPLSQAAIAIPPCSFSVYGRRLCLPGGNSLRRISPMRRRLYFVLPNVAAAEQTLRDLLLARIELRYVHCLAKRGMALGTLPEANFLQKTDTLHGATTGLAIGGAIGMASGALLMLYPPGTAALQAVTVLITGTVGAVLGMWVASMVGTAVPNSRLTAFAADIERGKVLMMVDLPFTRAKDIADLVHDRHPEAVAGGTEPTMPAFP